MWDAVITVFINVLLYIYDLVWNNFGLAIIFFTLLIRLISYPLYQLSGILLSQHCEGYVLKRRLSL